MELRRTNLKATDDCRLLIPFFGPTLGTHHLFSPNAIRGMAGFLLAQCNAAELGGDWEAECGGRPRRMGKSWRTILGMKEGLKLKSSA